MTTVVWQRVDTVGTEYAELGFDPLLIEGEVVLVEEATPSAVSYCVECDADGRTARATVVLKRSGTRGARTLVRTPEGRWTVDGRASPALDGLQDVDLSVTPSTNTAPLRRLQLRIGQSAEVIAAWVKFPTLEVVPLRQIYRRVTASIYAYEAPELDFRAELEVDELGVVSTYGALWKRLV